jgi:hypothetical protein
MDGANFAPRPERFGDFKEVHSEREATGGGEPGWPPDRNYLRQHLLY